MRSQFHSEIPREDEARHLAQQPPAEPKAEADEAATKFLSWASAMFAAGARNRAQA